MPSSTRSTLRFARSIAFCFLVGLAASALPAAADWLELEARYWAPDVSGGGAVDVGGFPIDLELGRDLGLEADAAPEGRITIRPGLGFFLRGRYTTLSSDGIETTDLGFTVGGIAVQLLVETESVLDFDYGGVALGWQFTSPGKKVRIGPFVEAKGVRGDASIQVRALGISQGFANDFEAGFASAGALLEIQPTDRWQIFAEASVLIEDDDADLTDAEVGVRFYPTDVLGLGVGYRTFQVDGTIDGVVLDLDYDGAFGSVQLRF
ncbi:MAG: hypothetical protein MI919_08810 [Holophagales bacterium]|nr:hypothetical protein [Holophagales bacterium]